MGDNVVLNGTVAQGLGEGALYLSMEHYKKEIKNKLGFEAYPGTLNLKVDENQVDLLGKMIAIKINGYKSEDKIFYGAKCFRARVQNISGAIIIPDRTEHKGTIEFIAPVHLKSELKIKDNDKIKVELIQ